MGSRWGHTKKEVELKLENKRSEKSVGVRIGSTQRKGWGCSARTKKEERLRVCAGGTERNWLASGVRRKKEKNRGSLQEAHNEKSEVAAGKQEVTRKLGDRNGGTERNRWGCSTRTREKIKRWGFALGAENAVVRFDEREQEKRRKGKE